MNRRALIRKAATFPKGSEERRNILAALKTVSSVDVLTRKARRSDSPPEIQKLNAEFYKKLTKAVHESGKWTYLDDPKDGLALWIEEYGSDQKGLRALRDEIISHLDSALKKLAPIARDIDDKIRGLG